MLAVLLTECLAALALIVSVTVHERNVQFRLLDASLRSTSDLLFGAVQDAEDAGDNVLLDMRGITLPASALYCVVETNGRVLGGSASPLIPAITSGGFRTTTLNGQSYRFFGMSGDRIIDPGKDGGIHHPVTIVFGLPVGHVWHEVWEATRFVSIASALLLIATALLLMWIIRRLTQPIRHLAHAAEDITAAQWTFSAPPDAATIVELQPLVTALERAMIRVQASFQQQKRFTSDAAHELKTDLAIVKSSLQLLAMKPRTSEEYQSGIAVGLADVSRLEDTVRRMLMLARLEQASMSTDAACSLDEVLAQAVKQALPSAEMKSVRLHMDPLDQAPVCCDPHDALLLCSNILMNAIQYTYDGTTIRLGCETRDERCRLYVLDAGPGVGNEELPHLFEAFYRGDPSRSRASGGSGLGLSICKAVCDRIGGTISIANHSAGGAMVMVDIPLLAHTNELQR